MTCLLSVHVTSLKSYFLSAKAQIFHVVDSLLFINWQIWNNDQKPKFSKPEKAVKYTNLFHFHVFFLMFNVQPRGRSTKPKSGEVGKVRRSSSASVSGRRCPCICILRTGVFGTNMSGISIDACLAPKCPGTFFSELVHLGQIWVELVLMLAWHQSRCLPQHWQLYFRLPLSQQVCTPDRQ